MTRALFCAMLIALSGAAAAADDKAHAAKAPAAAPATSEPAKPAADANASATPPAANEEHILTVEKSNVPPKCVIKPVMSDDELRACGAHVGGTPAK